MLRILSIYENKHNISELICNGFCLPNYFNYIIDVFTYKGIVFIIKHDDNLMINFRIDFN